MWPRSTAPSVQQHYTGLRSSQIRHNQLANRANLDNFVSKQLITSADLSHLVGNLVGFELDLRPESCLLCPRIILTPVAFYSFVSVLLLPVFFLNNSLSSLFCYITGYFILIFDLLYYKVFYSILLSLYLYVTRCFILLFRLCVGILQGVLFYSPVSVLTCCMLYSLHHLHSALCKLSKCLS